MDINKLATRVTKREGGKKQLSIAQVKEVLRCLNDQLCLDTNYAITLYTLLRALKEPEEK